MGSNFTDLVLLVGTNPLPDFVVAEYFLEKNGNCKTVWLVHSEKVVEYNQQGTKEYADALKNSLRRRHNSIDLRCVALSDVSSSKKIEKDLEERLLKKISSGSSLHLNYTGGTKAMCIHTYRALEQKYKGSISFSYLDGRNFELLDDEQGRRITGDLRKEIRINLEELIELHGFKKCPSQDTDFGNLADLYRKWLEEEGFLGKYYPDYEEKVTGLLWKGYWDQREPKDQQEPKVLSGKEKKRLKENLVQRYGQENPYWKEAFERLPAGLGEKYNFLEGQWLEVYLYQVLVNDLGRKQGQDIWKNWTIRKEGGEKFELDVLLLDGYQLTGISCTTGKDKGLCKLKGFEIILRSRQIGGEEARAILVTGMKEHDELEKLENELKLETGGHASNILVLGQRDWKAENLADKIRNFIALEK